MGIFRKLAWFFKKEWKIFTAGVLTLIAVSIVNVFPPRMIGLVVDQIDKHTLTMPHLWLYLGIFLLCVVVQYIMRYMWRRFIFGGSVILEKTLRRQLFQHFLKMDQTFYQKHRIGDLMAHATNDIDAVRDVAGAGILMLADSLATGVTTIIAMAMFVDWRLTILAILPLPLLAVMATVLGNKIHNAFEKAQAAFSDLNNKTQESLLGVKVIKTLGQEQEDAQDFQKHVDHAIAANKKAYRLDALFDPMTSLIMGLSYVMIIILGGYYVIHNVISIGQLVTFISYMAALVWPMFAIGHLFNILERGNASYDRISKLLAQENDRVRPVKLAQSAQPHGDISFDVDEFAFPDDPQKAQLKDVHFTVKAGQTLGIVGETGSGKSTILRLLMREYDHYNGQIKMGDHLITSYPFENYMQALGYVPQTNFLFSMNLKENIRFADPTASQREVEKVAQIADVHADILRMEEGYETEVGEMGVSLSGGQKQRLAIARALLSHPELLILDDSLSAVDAKTENHILDALHESRQDKTTIISASRLSSVSQADEILVMDKGQIIERGTHEQLLKAGGWYAQTYDLQEKKGEK